MKVNNPTIKAAREFYDPIRVMTREIDKEILRVLLENSKGNKTEFDIKNKKSF